MSNADAPSFLKTATELALKASEAVLDLLKNPTITGRKSDRSIVTEADLKSDEVIRSGLKAAFPDHAVLTEETGLQGKADSEFVWIVDPLDGTKAYAKGLPGFCVMVGLLRRGEPYLGVVVDPLEERLYQAIQGEAAWHTQGRERRSLRVSSRNDLARMPVVFSTDFPEKPLQEMRRRLPGPALSPINSVGIKVVLLVRQEGDLYVNHHATSYWDTCAPEIILTEAGGRITDLKGSPLRYEMNGTYRHPLPTLASNGTRHEEVLKLLADISF